VIVKHDIDLISYEDLCKARPDLVESIARAAAAKRTTVEIEEAAKSFAGYPGRCKTCGAPIKNAKKSTASGQPTREADIPAAQVALKESFMCLGLSAVEAEAAAGLNEATVFGVKVSDLMKD
jgi:hypothetical protein